MREWGSHLSRSGVVATNGWLSRTTSEPILSVAASLSQSRSETAARIATGCLSRLLLDVSRDPPSSVMLGVGAVRLRLPALLQRPPSRRPRNAGRSGRPASPTPDASLCEAKRRGYPGSVARYYGQRLGRSRSLATEGSPERSRGTRPLGPGNSPPGRPRPARRGRSFPISSTGRYRLDRASKSMSYWLASCLLVTGTRCHRVTRSKKRRRRARLSCVSDCPIVSNGLGL